MDAMPNGNSLSRSTNESKSIMQYIYECLNFRQASHAHGKLVILQTLFSRPGNVTEFCKITEHFGKVMKFDDAPYELAECVLISWRFREPLFFIQFTSFKYENSAFVGCSKVMKSCKSSVKMSGNCCGVIVYHIFSTDKNKNVKNNLGCRHYV